MMVLLVIMVALVSFFLGKKYGEKQVLKNEQILLPADEPPAGKDVDEELVTLFAAAVAEYEASEEQQEVSSSCISN